jgi:hypothetical protein
MSHENLYQAPLFVLCSLQARLERKRAMRRIVDDLIFFVEVGAQTDHVQMKVIIVAGGIGGLSAAIGSVG